MSDYPTTQTMMRSTVIRVNKYGKRGETFDQLLNRILDELDNYKKEELMR